MDKAKVHVVAERKSDLAVVSDDSTRPEWSLISDLSDADYIVVHEGTVIEYIYANTWDEANAMRRLRHGLMYIKCGGQ